MENSKEQEPAVGNADVPWSMKLDARQRDPSA
jgi:hypothetical protein